MNRSASRLLLCLLAVCALPSLCAAQTAQPLAPAVWKPDPKLLSQLGPEVSVGDYKIRPPKGFAPYPVRHKESIYARFITCSYHPVDASQKGKALLGVIISSYTDTSMPSSPEQDMRTAQRSAKRVYKGYTDTSVQYGTINGLQFLRTHWQAISPITGLPEHGFIFVADINSNTVSITGIGAVPNVTIPLTLLEAAALTFRKG